MLEELLIQNFQAHEKTRVVFGPGITTIVGPSDEGKSAIIRALRWVATNQPGGDAFVRYGAKGATVKLVVDGRTVTRRRKVGGSVNTYHLDDEEYKAFGVRVPDTIADLINMPGLCWQGQHDPSFWFGETPGEVSRQLNAIVNLGIIDDTLANTAKAFSRARTVLELADENLTIATKEAAALAWVPECAEGLSEVERLCREADVATGRAVGLRDAVGVVRGSLSAVKAATGYAKATTGLFNAADTAAEAAKGAYRLSQAAAGAATALERKKAAALYAGATDALFAAAGAAALAAKEVKGLRQAVDSASQAHDRANTPIPDFAPIEAAFEAAFDAGNEVAALADIITSTKIKRTNLCQLEKNLIAAEKAMPKTCPMCGQSLPQTST